MALGRGLGSLMMFVGFHGIHGTFVDNAATKHTYGLRSAWGRPFIGGLRNVRYRRVKGSGAWGQTNKQKVALAVFGADPATRDEEWFDVRIICLL